MALYYRLHWDEPATFSPERASSAPWGETACVRCAGEGVVEARDGRERECPACDGTGEAPRVPGYSCCATARDLLRYFDARGGIPDGARIVRFSGRVVGTGPDGEPLVVPDMQRVEWLDETTLRALADHEADD